MYKTTLGFSVLEGYRRRKVFLQDAEADPEVYESATIWVEHDLYEVEGNMLLEATLGEGGRQNLEKVARIFKRNGWDGTVWITAGPCIPTCVIRGGRREQTKTV